MLRSVWWSSTEFGAKSNRVGDFIADTVLYGIIFYFSKFSNFVLWKGLLLSLLVGLGLAFVAGLARYLLKPGVDRWKAAIKRKRAEKNNTLIN